MFKTPVQDPYQAVDVKGFLGFRVLQGKKVLAKRTQGIQTKKQTWHNGTDAYGVNLHPQPLMMMAKTHFRCHHQIHHLHLSSSWMLPSFPSSWMPLASSSGGVESSLVLEWRHRLLLSSGELSFHFQPFCPVFRGVV